MAAIDQHWNLERFTLKPLSLPVLLVLNGQCLVNVERESQKIINIGYFCYCGDLFLYIMPLAIGEARKLRQQLPAMFLHPTPPAGQDEYNLPPRRKADAV
jgi:hypothetical protein